MEGHSELQADIRAVAIQVTDIKEQIHQIKHAQNDAMQKVIILEVQTKAHREADDALHAQMLSAMKTIEGEVITNRDLSTKRFDDLFAWRNKIYGVIAVFVLGATIWGHEIYETVRGTFK